MKTSISNSVMLAFIPWLCIALYGLALELGSPSTSLSAWFLTVGLLSALASTWHATGGGLGPSFLFLSTTTIFLGGRALPVLLGDDGANLAIIGFGEEFAALPSTVASYVLAVLLSAACVSSTALLGQHEPIQPTRDIRADFYRACFLLTLPLYLYKNFYYFYYLISNGGYLAIYQGTEHTEGVGIAPRVGSLLCLAAFTLYFFSESDKIRLRPLLVLFGLAFCTELLIGLRGKFFSTVLTFLLFYKLRNGGHFSFQHMWRLALTVVALSLTVQVLREQQDAIPVEGQPLSLFLTQQGVSAGVLMSVIQYPYAFAGQGLHYLQQQFLVPFIPQPEVQPGMFLADDLSIFMMPEAYALGFGTGSSYLAELALLGGWIGIALGSLLVGLALRRLGRYCNGLGGALAFWVVAGLVFYPRAMLHEPLFQLLRYAPPMLLLWTVAGAWIWLTRIHPRIKATEA